MARPETLDDLLKVCVEHSRRSRGEPGCLAHNVHRDVENPLRLLFVEEWADLAALRAHFAVPASGGTVSALRTLAAEPPTMQIYEASPARR